MRLAGTAVRPLRYLVKKNVGNKLWEETMQKLITSKLLRTSIMRVVTIILTLKTALI